MAKVTALKTNFIYPNITPDHYRFGSGEVVGIVINPTGDWRNYTPPTEYQNKHGIESSACFIEAQQHAIATIQEEQFGLPDQNYSARFNALLADGTENGGDPLAGGDSLRNDGMVGQDVMDFNENILSWDDFHSWKGVDETFVRSLGKEFIKKWKLNYDIVFQRENIIEDKYRKLKAALKYSPVPMSVMGWYQDDQGQYIKPEGSHDNHLVLCVYLDENNCPWIFDTYEPFVKKLSPYYNSDFALRWSVSQLQTIKKKENIFQGIIDWIMVKLALMKRFYAR